MRGMIQTCKDIFDRKTLQRLREKAGDDEKFEEYKKLLRECYDKYKQKYGAEKFFVYSDKSNIKLLAKKYGREKKCQHLIG